MIHRLVKNDYSVVFGNQIKDGYETSATHHLWEERRCAPHANAIPSTSGV